MSVVKSLAVLLFLLVIQSAIAQIDGQLDLRYTDLSEEAAPIQGPWEFYPNQLIGPNDASGKSKSNMTFPSTWSAYDYGTYRIRILLPSSYRSKALAIEVPPVFSSYLLFADGKQIGANGRVGVTREQTQPEWKPAIYIIENHSDTLSLTLQIANFYHSNGGGLKSLNIAEAGFINAKANFTKISDYALFSCLLTLGLVSFCLYYIKRGNQLPFLFLSFFVFTWMIRSFTSNQYRVLDWIDLPWNYLIRIEYLSIYCTMVTALWFLSSLFPIDFRNKKLKVIFLVLCSIFSLFTLFTEAIVFTQYLILFLSVGILLIIYLLFVISKAFINDRAGSTIMLITLLLGAITFGYVIIAYIGYMETNMVVYNFGFIILFTLLAISMSVRLSKLAGRDESDMLTFDQLYKNDI
jgi:hypothetical protein